MPAWLLLRHFVAAAFNSGRMHLISPYCKNRNKEHADNQKERCYFHFCKERQFAK